MLRSVLVLSLLLARACAKRSATPIANPHQPAAALACLSSPAVTRAAILGVPLLATQADTLVGVETVEVSGVPVLIYSFKQPARLSPLELPFKVLPVARIDTAGVVALRVGERQAADSWFPGFKWDVLVDVASCAEPAHIGWRFRPVGNVGNDINEEEDDNKATFDALIVKTTDNDALSAAASFVDALRAKFAVGVPAAPWMLALLAAQAPPAKLSL